MKRTQKSVPGALPGAVATDDGYKSNAHGTNITPVFGGQTDGVRAGSHSRGGTLARPGRSVPMGAAHDRLPLQKPPANQVGIRLGQTNPASFTPPGPAATAIKPNPGKLSHGPVGSRPVPRRRGKGAAFYGEY